MSDVMCVVGLGAKGREWLEIMRRSLVRDDISFIVAEETSPRDAIDRAKSDIVCVVADMSDSSDAIREAADALRGRDATSIACVAAKGADRDASVRSLASSFDAYFIHEGDPIGDEMLRPLFALADMISEDGVVNINLYDIKAFLRGAGRCSFGSGESATGDEHEAVRCALAHAGISSRDDASRAMMMIYGGASVSMQSLLTISGALSDAVDEDALVLWAHIVDETLGDVIRVVLIVSPDSAVIPLPQMKISLDL